MGSGALLCVYSAIASLPLASATVLQYLYPTFTALLAWLGLGEHLTPRVWVGMGLGWLGVVLVALSDKEVSDLLLYVACTRAVSGLTIIGPRSIAARLGLADSDS